MAIPTTQILKEGKILLYPTDTVWGLGCDATNPDAVARIYQIKQRSESKSLIVLVSNLSMLQEYVATSIFRFSENKDEALKNYNRIIQGEMIDIKG